MMDLSQAPLTQTPVNGLLRCKSIDTNMQEYHMQPGDVFAFVSHFSDEARRVKSIASLYTLLEDATTDVGFAHFSIVEHRTSFARSNFIELTNYPAEWNNIILTREFYLDDPVISISNHCVTPFLWEDLQKMLTLTSRQRTILECASSFGLANAITVPLHMPGRLPASANFVYPTTSAEGWQKAAAYQIGLWGFEAARRLLETRASGRARLTDRQCECLILIARGYSDWSAGQILGLSQRTVREHLDNAKVLYDVSSRSQLISRALFDGQITYADVLTQAVVH
jgi:LuxR family transcriptional regulator, quorum-sensing system regulator CciR